MSSTELRMMAAVFAMDPRNRAVILEAADKIDRLSAEVESLKRWHIERGQIIDASIQRELSLRAEVEALRADALRIDFLEAEANTRGGILLHDGTEKGRRGYGLRPGHVVRSLRQAIDAGMAASRGGG